VDIHFTGFKSSQDREYSVEDPKIRLPPPEPTEEELALQDSQASAEGVVDTNSEANDGGGGGKKAGAKGKRKQATTSPANGSMAKKKMKRAPAARQSNMGYVGEENESQFYEADDERAGSLKQFLRQELEAARFDHAWPLLMEQEIVTLELLADVTVEGLVPVWLFVFASSFFSSCP